MDNGSDDSSNSEEEEEEEVDEDDNENSIKWDPKFTSQYYTFDKKKKIGTYTYTGNYWAGTLCSTKTKKYSIKLGSQCSYLMFGMAQSSNLNKTTCNYTSGGFYMYPNGNCYYGTGKTNNIIYGSDTQIGTIYGVDYNRKKGDIKFYKNGVFAAIGFSGNKNLKLCAVVDAYYNNSSYELVKGKYKKK